MIIHKKEILENLESFKADLKPFAGNAMDWKKVDAAIELLREIAYPKEVEYLGADTWHGDVCMCKDCRTEWMCDGRYTHFCPGCGRAVEWK